MPSPQAACDDIVKGCLFSIACEEIELANTIYAITGKSKPEPAMLNKLLENNASGLLQCLIDLNRDLEQALSEKKKQLKTCPAGSGEKTDNEPPDTYYGKEQDN